MAALPAIPSDLEETLRAAIQRRFGTAADINALVLATLGGSNRTILFDLVEPAGRRRLVSREETFTGSVNPFLTPAMQFRIMKYVHAHGVTAPEPIFLYDDEDGLGPGFVTAFVAGETLPRRLLAAQPRHDGLVRDLVSELVGLHALDIKPVSFLDHVVESGDPIAAMRLRLDSLEEPHPALELGLRWLELNPTPASHRVLVHGDFRNGNFMVANGRLTALLDWECSHLGAPAEDLGWLCTRSWRFGRFGQHAGGFSTRTELIAAYARAGGDRLSEDDVRWWERYGLVRWAMYNILQAYGFSRGRRSPAYAACGRNVSLMEYDLLMTLAGEYD